MESLDAGRCTHPTLVEMPALYGWYACPACGDFFNLELIHLVRHTPRDLRAMADAFLDALGRPAGRVFSTDPAPAVPPSAGAGKEPHTVRGSQQEDYARIAAHRHAAHRHAAHQSP